MKVVYCNHVIALNPSKHSRTAERR